MCADTSLWPHDGRNGFPITQLVLSLPGNCSPPLLTRESKLKVVINLKKHKEHSEESEEERRDGPKPKCSVAQSCPTRCEPTGCSPPGSSVHGILQASSRRLLQRSLPALGSNPSLLQCRQILYGLSHQGSPRREERNAQGGKKQGKEVGANKEGKT